MNRAALSIAVSLALAPPAAAHNGGGTFDSSKEGTGVPVLDGLGPAIGDRLRRAAAGRIVRCG